MATLNEQRGIRNVQQRVSQLPTRQTVAARHLRRVKQQRDIGITEPEETLIYALEQEQLATEVEMQQAHAAHTSERLGRTLLSKKTKLRMSARAIARLGIGAALTAYFWQFIFALISLVGFGFHAQVLYVREQTMLGKVVGFFVEFQNYLPFQYIGYAFWVLTILLVVAVFTISYFIFLAIKIDPLATPLSTFITAACLGFSVLPVTNILPWLVLWVIYLGLFSNDP